MPILPKIVTTSTSLEVSEKLVRIDNIHANTFHLMKKIAKIGEVDCKIHSPVGNLAERAK